MMRVVPCYQFKSRFRRNGVVKERKGRVRRLKINRALRHRRVNSPLLSPEMTSRYELDEPAKKQKRRLPITTFRCRSNLRGACEREETIASFCRAFLIESRRKFARARTICLLLILRPGRNRAVTLPTDRVKLD